jgi:uncharacterized protein
MGLAYLPYVAVMNSRTGPVINLYNACTASALTPTSHPVELKVATDYPKSASIAITVNPRSPERFSIRLRIPAWSALTRLRVAGKTIPAAPGAYANINRVWSAGDKITLTLDMRCRLLTLPHGSNRAGDNHQALVRGPVVLARDENIDVNYSQPVTIIAKAGFVDITAMPPTLPTTRMQFRVPTQAGFIPMVDYASVDNWSGKHVCTWLPNPGMGQRLEEAKSGASARPGT